MERDEVKSRNILSLHVLSDVSKTVGDEEKIRAEVLVFHSQPYLTKHFTVKISSFASYVLLKVASSRSQVNPYVNHLPYELESNSHE